jgi:hypothetical protein
MHRDIRLLRSFPAMGLCIEQNLFSDVGRFPGMGGIGHRSVVFYIFKILYLTIPLNDAVKFLRKFVVFCTMVNDSVLPP